MQQRRETDIHRIPFQIAEDHRVHLALQRRQRVPRRQAVDGFAPDAQGVLATPPGFVSESARQIPAGGGEALHDGRLYAAEVVKNRRSHGVLGDPRRHQPLKAVYTPADPQTRDQRQQLGVGRVRRGVPLQIHHGDCRRQVNEVGDGQHHPRHATWPRCNPGCRPHFAELCHKGHRVDHVTPQVFQQMQKHVSTAVGMVGRHVPMQHVGDRPQTLLCVLQCGGIGRCVIARQGAQRCGRLHIARERLFVVHPGCHQLLQRNRH